MNSLSKIAEGLSKGKVDISLVQKQVEEAEEYVKDILSKGYNSMGNPSNYYIDLLYQIERNKPELFKRLKEKLYFFSNDRIGFDIDIKDENGNIKEIEKLYIEKYFFNSGMDINRNLGKERITRDEMNGILDIFGIENYSIMKEILGFDNSNYLLKKEESTKEILWSGAFGYTFEYPSDNIGENKIILKN